MAENAQKIKKINTHLICKKKFEIFNIKEHEILKIMVKSVFSKSLSFKRYARLKIEVEK